MFEKFSRSWSLVKYSAGVLRQDKELLVFPLLSSIAAILVALTFVPLLMQTGLAGEQGPTEASAGDYAVMFALYLAEYFVIFFFNAALVGAALIRMDGGDPTVRDGLRIATSRIGSIFGYAMIAATVGVILRAVAERLGTIGQFIIGLIGLAWTVTTFLTVPVLVTRDIGPIDAVKQSATLLKKTWGENIIANAGLGFVFVLVYIAMMFVFAGLVALVQGSGPAVISVFVVAIVALVIVALIQGALQGIFSAALYRYAVDGPDQSDPASKLLGEAFKPKSA
ncbi:MAG: DUF6159 family protein [Gammaproteobacteria bacterium]